MKTLAFRNTLALLVTVASFACKSDDNPSGTGTESDASTGETSASATTASTSDPDATGPETSATTASTTSTSNTDVTGDPSGPETDTDPDSSTGEVDPPTEPEIVLERPAGAFFENIGRDTDGTILVIAHTDQQVLSLTPQGAVDVFVEMDDWPFSVVVDGDGTAIIAAHGQMIFDQAQPFVTTNMIYIADRAGGADLLTDVPEANFINGICLLEPGVLLGVDSSASSLFRIDVGSGDVSTWIDDPLLSPDQGGNIPAANGCKIYDGAVYVSNSDRQTIVRIPIEGSDAGQPAVYFNGPLIDDFAFGASGAIYATTHANDVLRIAPDLTFEVIAGAPEGVVGNTALVFGGTAFDDETVYVSTDGGLYVAGGNAAMSGPGRVVRVPVGEVGY